MPKVGQPTKQDSRIETALAERREFVEGFQRSRKGNLWRTYEGLTVSVFQRRDGLYGWSVASSDGPTYSDDVYELEDEALESLAWELNVGVY